MRIPGKLLSTFIKLGGGRFRGFLTTPNLSSSTSTIQAFRLFHVPRPCNAVTVGDVIQDPNGNMLLLLEAAQGMVNTRTFRVVQVSHVYSWIRMVKNLDPVSRMPRDGYPEDMGPLYGYFENPKDISLGGLTDSKYQFYTGQDVQIGDKVDDKLVKKITSVLGVKLVIAE